MTATIRYAFVKYRGDVDEGNQILGYVGNKLECAFGITVPYISEDLSPKVAQASYYEKYITAYGFDAVQAKAIASRNFWNYKQGATDLDEYHLITKIPFTLINSTHYVDAPYAHP